MSELLLKQPSDGGAWRGRRLSTPSGDFWSWEELYEVPGRRGPGQDERGACCAPLASEQIQVEQCNLPNPAVDGVVPEGIDSEDQPIFAIGRRSKELAQCRQARESKLCRFPNNRCISTSSGRERSWSGTTRRIFLSSIERVRKQRNKIAHLNAGNVSVEAERIMVDILTEFDFMFSSIGWIKFRKMYIDLTNRDAWQFDGDDWSHSSLMGELEVAINTLSGKYTKRFFKYNKRKRHYRCPNCENLKARHDESEHKFLEITKDDTYYCVACPITFTPEEYEKAGRTIGVMTRDRLQRLSVSDCLELSSRLRGPPGCARLVRIGLAEGDRAFEVRRLSGSRLFSRVSTGSACK